METDKYTSKDIELRSEEANDILNTPPPKLLRISNVIIFFIAVILLLLSFTISIPIYSKIPVRLESLIRNQKIQEGEIMLNKLMVKPVSLQTVEKDQVIGVLDSAADYTEIDKLDKLIESTQKIDEKSIFKQIHVSDLGGFRNDYLKYKFGEISAYDFYLRFVGWKDKNLIISDKKGKLFIEVNKSGKAEYKIYPENGHLKYMIAELSQENISQLKGKDFFLTVISPKKYKNKKVKVSLMNEKYDKNKNKFEAIFEVQNSELLSDNRFIDGQINVLLREEKFIYLLLPFLENK